MSSSSAGGDSNPQRISKKIGGLGSGEDGISPIPCGSGWRMGRHGPWPRPSSHLLAACPLSKKLDHDSNKKTALVAGATGVVGRNLLRRLVSDPDWDVIAVSRRK